MAFSYTEALKAASPLKGGKYAGFAMGTCGNTAAGVAGLVSTTLASVVYATVNVYGSDQQTSGAFIESVSTNGMMAINFGAACSGSWIAFGN